MKYILIGGPKHGEEFYIDERHDHFRTVVERPKFPTIHWRDPAPCSVDTECVTYRKEQCCFPRLVGTRNYHKEFYFHDEMTKKQINDYLSRLEAKIEMELMKADPQTKL